MRAVCTLWTRRKKGEDLARISIFWRKILPWMSVTYGQGVDDDSEPQAVGGQDDVSPRRNRPSKAMPCRFLTVVVAYASQTAKVK
jgi:hypothetical protein